MPVKQLFTNNSIAALGAEGVLPFLDVDAIAISKLGSAMLVLHDTVPDYGVADKLNVDLTTVSETRRHSFLSVTMRCPNFRRMHWSMPNIGWTKPASAYLWQASCSTIFGCVSFTWWKLASFSLLSPFNGCLPRMDRPNYGACEIRQHFDRLRVFTLASWETEVTVERQDSLDEWAGDNRMAPETARFRRWMSPGYARCATPLKTCSAFRLFFSP